MRSRRPRSVTDCVRVLPDSNARPPISEAPLLRPGSAMRWLARRKARLRDRARYARVESGCRPALVVPLIAILCGRDAEARLEPAIERTDRPVTAVERDREHWKHVVGGRREPAGRLAEPVFMEEIVEVAVAEMLVDRAAQQVLLRVQLGCE